MELRKEEPRKETRKEERIRKGKKKKEKEKDGGKKMFNFFFLDEKLIGKKMDMFGNHWNFDSCWKMSFFLRIMNANSTFFCSETYMRFCSTTILPRPKEL